MTTLDEFLDSPAAGDVVEVSRDAEVSADDLNVGITVVLHDDLGRALCVRMAINADGKGVFADIRAFWDGEPVAPHLLAIDETVTVSLD